MIPQPIPNPISAHVEIKPYQILQSVFAVGRQGCIQLFGIGELQVGHDLNKLWQGFGESWIACTLFRHRRRHQTLVVMGGIDRCTVTKTEDTRMYGMVQLLGRALLKICECKGWWYKWMSNRCEYVRVCVNVDWWSVKVVITISPENRYVHNHEWAMHLPKTPDWNRPKWTWNNQRCDQGYWNPSHIDSQTALYLHRLNVYPPPPRMLLQSWIDR